MTNTIFDKRKRDASAITVIVPTYKRMDLLSQTLDSLVSQSCSSFDVVVVDNDSENTCGLDNLVKKYTKTLSIALFRNKQNVGMYGNWDVGMSLSRTKWVTILHDDDLFAPSFISDADIILNHYPKIEMLLFPPIKFYGKSTPPKHPKAITRFSVSRVRSAILKNKIYKLYYFDYLLKYQHLGTLGAVFLKEHAMKIGGFGGRSHISSDYFFFEQYRSNFEASYICSYGNSYYRYSVNESLRLDTLVCTTKECRCLRASMLINFKPKWAAKLILNALTANQIVGYRGLGSEINTIDELINRLKREYGISTLKCSVYSLVVRAIYNAYQFRRVFIKPKAKRLLNNKSDM